MNARTNRTQRKGKVTKSTEKPTVQTLGAELAALKKRFYIECKEHDLHVLELSARERDLQTIFDAMGGPKDVAVSDRARWVACRISNLLAIEALHGGDAGDRSAADRSSAGHATVPAYHTNLESLKSMNDRIRESVSELNEKRDSKNNALCESRAAT